MKQKLLNNLRLRAVWLVAMMLCAVTGAWADEETITFSKIYGTNTVLDGTAINGTDCSITFNKRNGGTATQYYTNGSAVRWYGGGTMVVSSETKTIEQIEITFTQTANSITVDVGEYDDNTWTGSANSVTFTQSGTTGQCRISEITVTYSDGGEPDVREVVNMTAFSATSTTLIKGATTKTTVTNDQNGWSAAYTYTSSNEDVATVDENGDITAVAKGGATITATLNVDPEDENYKAGSTKSKTIEITVNNPTHIATFSINGNTDDTDEFEEGESIVFPTGIADVESKKFVGWVAETISGVTDEEPNFVTSATMGESDVTYYAVFATQVGSEDDASISITSSTGNIPKSYGSQNAFDECVLEGITFQVQQMFLNGTKLQWRAAGNSNGTGTIYNSDALSHIQSIVLVYDASDSNKNFTLHVGTDKNPTDGTLITPSANGTTYTFDCSGGDYSYFVLANGSGAGYLLSLTINYKEDNFITSGYCTTVAADTRQNPELSFSFTEVNASIGVAPELPKLNKAEGFNGTVEYESSDESVAQIMDGETGELRLLKEGTTTITATFAGNDDYKAGSASYSLTVTDNRTATTTTQEAIELDLADIESLTRLAPVVKDANDEIVAYSYDEWPTEMSFEIVSDENYLIGSLDNNTGEIILNEVEGTVTLKAYYNYFNVNSSYKPSECTFTITVSDSHAPGAVNNPYSVAEAIEFIETLDGATSSKQVYVTGVISQIDSYNSTYKSIQYWISDDGTTTGQMEVYSGKGLNDTDFSAVTDLELGDVVTVYGYVKMYKSTTPEFDKNNYIVSLVRKSEAGLAYETAEYNANLGEDFDTPELTNPNELTVAYSSSNTEVATVDENTGAVTLVAAGETIITATFEGNESYKAGEASYTLTVIDPNEPVDICELVSITPTTLTIGDIDNFVLTANFVDGVVEGEDYEITWTSSDPAVLDLAGTTYEAVAAGTVTITVNVEVYDEDTYNNVSKEFTVKVEAPKTWVALVSEYDGEYYAMNKEFSNGTYQSTKVDVVNGKVINGEANDISWSIEASGNGVSIQNRTTENFVGYSSSTNLTKSADPYEWTVDEENNSWTVSTTRSIIMNSSYGFKAYAISNLQPNQTGYANIYTTAYTFAPGYIREVSAGNFGTICLAYDVEAEDFSGVKFYKIASKKVENEQVKSVVLEEVDELIGGVAYIYQAEEGAEKLIAAYSGDEEDEPFDAEISETGLTGTYEAAYIPVGKYVLKDNTLHYVNQANYVKSGANKAYIDLANVPVNNGANVKGIRINVSNDYLTGINGVNVDGRQNVIFNLSGQRVSNANKGVYIVNGKKISVK